MISAQAKIDFVVFWVDGNDPEHRRKRLKYLKQFSLALEKNYEQSISDLRFVQHDELKYCLRSIKQHAPWYNNIYLVTDNQIPAFLEPHKLHLDRIVLIDHKELFSDTLEYLPTFNSRVLTTQLHKLEQLSDCFLLGNDDVMLGHHVEPDFFFAGGKPVLHVDKALADENSPLTLFKTGILNAAKMLGFDESEFYLPSHGFMPLDKVRIKSLESRFNVDFRSNLKHKFRHESQFLLESLYIHSCIKSGQCVLADTGPMVHFSFELCRIGDPDKIQFLFDLIKSGQRKMFCLNEFQAIWPRIPFVKPLLEEICGEPLISEMC